MEVVNGYVCNTCADVSNAKRNIDPAHPKDGPDGIYAADRKLGAADDRGPAVTLSGALAAVTPAASADRPQPYEAGQGFDISA